MSQEGRRAGISDQGTAFINLGSGIGKWWLIPLSHVV